MGVVVDDCWLFTSRETNSRWNLKKYNRIIYDIFIPSIGSWEKAKAAYGSFESGFWDEFPVDVSEGTRSDVLEANPLVGRGRTP